MKYLKYKRSFNQITGITLISLIVTIIVLLILAGVSISMLTGSNGLISKSQNAKEETLKSQALEELRLKVLQVQIDKQGAAKLQDVANALSCDTKNDYILSTKPSDITGEIIDLTNASNFFVKYNNYWFLINLNLEVNLVNDSDITDNDKIDSLPPPNFSPYITIIDNNSILISTDVEDSEPNEENSKSGIAYYEYYVSNKKIAESSNPSYKISNINFDEKPQVYIIAYDNADNFRESYHKTIYAQYNSLEDFYSNGVPFSNNNNSNSYLAFDNNSSTYWDGKNIDSYIGYDFGTAVECTNVKISQPYYSDVIRHFKIQYSDDNITYYDASEQLEYIRGNGDQLFNLNLNVGPHRYWRYKNIDNYTNNSYCVISELTFLTRQYISSTNYIFENDILSSAFSNNNSSTSYLVFDNNSSTYWDGKNIDSYIGYDFGTAVECTNVKISQPYYSDVIRHFKIQYSDDNITYYDASEQLEYIRGNGDQLFNLNLNVGPHRYWQYKNIDNYTNNSFCGISELEFLKIEYIN